MKRFSLLYRSSLLKWLVGLALALGAQSAMAQSSNSCIYELQDGRGYLVRNYYGYSSQNRWLACDNARRQCETGLIIERRRNPRAYCIESRIGNPYPPVPPRPPVPPTPRPPHGHQCSSDLHRYDGRVLQTFYGRGANAGQACRQARQRCESALRRGGNRRGSYCTTTPGPRRPW